MRNLLVCVGIAVCGCAHPLAKVQPGMTTSEIRSVTGEVAPSEVVPNSNGSQTWFYGKNMCLLLVNDRVVAKWSAEASVPGATASSVCMPQSQSSMPY